MQVMLLESAPGAGVAAVRALTALPRSVRRADHVDVTVTSSGR